MPPLECGRAEVAERTKNNYRPSAFCFSARANHALHTGVSGVYNPLIPSTLSLRTHNLILDSPLSAPPLNIVAPVARDQTMPELLRPPWSNAPNAPKVPLWLYCSEKADLAGTIIAAMFYGQSLGGSIYPWSSSISVLNTPF